ncbi:MAG: hypothetical protein ACRCWR_06930 [Saezia sp.]
MRLLRFFHLRWLLNKRVVKQVAWGLLWIILVILVSVGVSIAGVHLAGDIAKWGDFLKQYASVFLLWRVFLYAGLVYGWLWMRKRVIAREASHGCDETQAKRRLLVCEVCTAMAILVMEVSNWLV